MTTPVVDPITFAVVKSALDAIVDEMAYTVIRTARSEIIKDVMDYSAALCDARGRMIAQAKTIAQHLGAIPDAMQSVLTQFTGDLHPGDVVIMNDPYEGGMHLPDVFMFMPVFDEEVREAFAVVIGHQRRAIRRRSHRVRPLLSAGPREASRHIAPHVVSRDPPNVGISRGRRPSGACRGYAD